MSDDSVVNKIGSYFGATAPLDSTFNQVIREGASFALGLAIAHCYPEWAAAAAMDILDTPEREALLREVGKRLIAACPVKARQ